MIQKAIFKNFLGHESITFDNLSGITLIIGENDTCKTGLLKMLYAVAKSLEIAHKKQPKNGVSFKKILGEKIDTTFQPRKSGIGELVMKGSADKKLAMDFHFKGSKYAQQIKFSFGETTTQVINDCTEVIEPMTEPMNALFIPAKEVLTAFRAIKFTRDPNFLLGFDDTYFDLIKSLEIPTQKGRIKDNLVDVNNHLEALFEGLIHQKEGDDAFLFKKGNAEFGMSLTAEGIKKMGIITTLIRNRQLGKNTILFFDEPETALHPKAIRKLTEMLVSMSKAGVQIFMATHCYFVIKQLCIAAKREKIDITCCSLEKSAENKKIIPVFNNLLDGMPDNPIIEEALKMFDEEVNLDF
jgi:predicted ATP-dependent endonuclease of OLD family